MNSLDERHQPGRIERIASIVDIDEMGAAGEIGCRSRGKPIRERDIRGNHIGPIEKAD